MIPDVNVLIAAFRKDHSHHPSARTWLQEACRNCATGQATLVLLPVVLAGFIRLVTNSRVFVNPDSVEDAVSFIDAILQVEGAEVGDGVNEWSTLRGLLLAHAVGGNFVTDAWIAAAVQSRGEHLVTFDRDFEDLLPARDLTLLR